MIDKPAGMITHPAHAARSGTLVNALLGYLQGALPGDAFRPGLVHRLDRDTSGLLVVAKNEASLSALGKAMKSREIEREYLGLVIGVPEHARGTIEGPIGRDPGNRLKFAVVADGKPAITHYEVRDAFARHAELAFRLETGRTHQIRVHLAAMGHALVNDRVYGRRTHASIFPVKRCTHGASRSRIRGRASRSRSKRRRHPVTQPRANCSDPAAEPPVTASFALRTTAGDARRGSLALAHGTVETPCFMPVGTAQR